MSSISIKSRWVLGLMLVLAAAAIGPASAEDTRPSIVLIMVVFAVVQCAGCPFREESW